jgi:thioredoxin reductase (NADPH)
LPRRHDYDVIIIGVGVAGLYAAYCCGFLAALRVCIVESAAIPGGQCVTLYPRKKMYGVPGFPDITARDYISILSDQCLPHAATSLFNQKINCISRLENEFFQVGANRESISSKFLILATGIGDAIPNIPSDILLNIDNASDFVQHYCINMNLFAGKRIVIAGGGDSAVDFAIELSMIAEEIVLVHRRPDFSCEPAKTSVINELSNAGKILLKLNHDILALEESDAGRYVKIRGRNALNTEEIMTDHIIFCYGFSAKHSTIRGLEEMGIQSKNFLIEVNIETMKTSVNDCYAIGDAITYPGKKKNVVSCLFEADRAGRAIRNKVDQA